MPNITGLVPRYEDDDAHIIRRLGAAVVAQWDDLPESVQDLLVEQATFVWDRHETVQLKQTIELFLAAHKGWTNSNA